MLVFDLPLENEIRKPIRSAHTFRVGSARRMKLPPWNGISLVMGKLKKEHVKKGKNPNAMVAQAYSFDKRHFDDDKANQWFKKYVTDRYKLNNNRIIAHKKHALGNFIVADKVNDTTQPIKDKEIKRFISYLGLEIGIEYNVGDDRHGKTMQCCYGKVVNYVGNDGDLLDVYVKEPISPYAKIFKITQLKNGALYDEDKYILGCETIEDARNLYLLHMYESMIGGIVEVSIADIYAKHISLVAPNKIITDKIHSTVQLPGFLLPIDINESQLLDRIGGPVRARILVTQANIENLNKRKYSLESLQVAVAEAQERVRLGLIVGFENHPDELYNGQGDAVSYDYAQNPPLFRVTKLWMVGDIVYAEATFFDTQLGIAYSNKLRNGQRIPVSLRAFGECERQLVPNKDGELVLERICAVEKIDGLDVVKNPALITAQVLEYAEIVDTFRENNDNRKCNHNGKCSCNGLCKNKVKASGKLLADQISGGQISTTRGVSSNMEEQILQLVESLGASPEVLSVLKAYHLGQASATGMAMPAMETEEEFTPVDQTTDGTDPGEKEPTEGGAPNTEKTVDAFKPEKVLNPATDTVNKVVDASKTAVTDAVKEKQALYDDIKKLLADGFKGIALPAKSQQKVIPTQPKSKPVQSPTGLSQKITDDLMGVFNQVIQKNQPLSQEMTDYLKIAIERDKKEQQRLSISQSIADARKADEVKITVDGQEQVYKISGLPTALVDRAENAAKRHKNPDTAISAFNSAIQAYYDAQADRMPANSILPTQRLAGKSVPVEVLTDGSLWKDSFDQLDSAIDTYRRKLKPNEVEKVATYSKLNGVFLDSILTAWDQKNSNRLNDWGKKQKRAVTDGIIVDDATIISGGELRNQPIIARMMIKQIFQKLIAMGLVQGLGPGSALGSPGAGGAQFGAEFKIPVSSYNGATNQDPDNYVDNNQPVPRATSNIRFESFWARLRALGFGITYELEEQLQNGALMLDPVAMLVDDISGDMARSIDTGILKEHQWTCDEFQAVPVINELAIIGNTEYDAGGSVAITYDDDTVTYGTTVVFAVKALSGGIGGIPIVPTRTVPYLDAAGAQQSNTTNPITVTFAASPQVLGRLVNGDIVGAGATYAIDYERGYFLFNALSGANGTLMPTLSYSYATNYVNFDLTPTFGQTPEEYYDGLLHLILQTGGNMFQTRFQFPDLCLFPASIGLGTIGISSLFHKRKSPTDTTLPSGFYMDDIIGQVSGITCMKTNGVMFGGDRRAILFKRYMVGYGVQTPAQIVGPQQNFYAPDGGGLVQMTTGEQWMLWLRDVIGTPLQRNGSLAVINHPGTTIRFRHSVAFV